MGVVKVSRSGKAVLFISDSGEVYVTSKSMLLSLLGDGSAVSGRVLLLSRMARGLRVDRFAPSPVYTAPGMTEDIRDGDGLDKKSIESVGQAVMYQDKVVL